MDRQSSSSMDDVKKSALDLEISRIKVIPVAIGDQADKKELITITTPINNLVEVGSKDPANRTAEKIVVKALEGKEKHFTLKHQITEISPIHEFSILFILKYFFHASFLKCARRKKGRRVMKDRELHRQLQHFSSLNSVHLEKKICKVLQSLTKMTIKLRGYVA